jgi:hypothetical protein
MKLKIDGIDKIVSSYCSGDGVSTPASFKRRAYWFIDSPKHILVHYLDEIVVKNQCKVP